MLIFFIRMIVQRPLGRQGWLPRRGRSLLIYLLLEVLRVDALIQIEGGLIGGLFGVALQFLYLLIFYSL